MPELILSPEEIQDLRKVMSLPEGRRVIRRWMAKTGMYRSAMRMRPNVAPDERLLFNAAQSDFGKRMQAEVMAADPVGFQLMNSECAAQKALAKDKDKPGTVVDDDNEEMEE
jgi:hypothetical protein